MGCPKCKGPLSSQGSCYRLSCLPEERTKFTGKGTGHGDLNLLARQRQAKSRCPLCIDSNGGRGCWPSVCHNGPYDPRLGLRKACDCHRLFKATNPHVRAELRAKAFSQWSAPRPAL